MMYEPIQQHVPLPNAEVLYKALLAMHPMMKFDETVAAAERALALMVSQQKLPVIA